MSPLAQELRRKAFHMLSLGYLIAYHVIGYPRIKGLLAVWMAVVAFVEIGRFLIPPLGRFLVSFFEGLIRETERKAFSGIFYTTAGSLIVITCAGDKPAVVTASLLYLALGDAAAAVGGKLYGKTKLLGGPKSLEGSLANLLTCLACGLGAGLAPLPLIGGAAAASLVELVPNTRFYNDNLGLPVASAAVLLLLGAA